MTKDQSLILYPELYSKLIIKQNKKLVFCCQTDQDYTIELWSNLTLQKKWIAFPFTKLNDYQLVISTDNLEPGQYEFTLRFKRENEPWSWYGHHNENGRVHIVPLFSVTTPIMPRFDLIAEELVEPVNLWHFKASSTSPNRSFSLGKIKEDAYVACIRKG